MRVISKWWGVDLGYKTTFHGRALFYRHPNSTITIGNNCSFNSSIDSNFIGINRNCMISTLKPKAQIIIGDESGFSGTVITSAKKIVIGNNVRCGGNTLITDTDWHTDDPRAGSDAEVIIENNVWLGEGVKVLKGVSIGMNSLIAAGSVVTKSVDPNCIYGGIPAMKIRDL